MINKREELIEEIETNNGRKVFSQFLLNQFDGVNKKLKQFSVVEVNPNEEIEYHVHEGDSDFYYIISGKGLYNDNGVITEVSAGTVTFTPSGEGHALKNISEEQLVFIALVIDD